MMSFMYAEINVLSMAILLVIFLNVRRMEPKLTEQNLFISLIGTDAAILIIDTAMWLLDGVPGILARACYQFVTAVYYIMNPLICLLWLLYVDYQVFRDESHIRRTKFLMLIPFCADIIFSVCSIFGGFMSYIDDHNIYHRGKLFFLLFVFSYFYLVYAILFIIHNRKKIQRQNFFPLLSFALPPFIGGIIQSMYYGVSTIWPASTISILVIFINIQNDQAYTDHLTGLFNRRQLDYYLQQRIQSDDKRQVAGIMIDLDSFKLINDMYGHFVGDQALEHMAQILKVTFRKGDFVARYGGDEFIIILNVEKKSDLMRAVERLQKNIHQFNAQKIVPYSLSVSLGYDFMDCKSGDAIKEFLENIDRLMYENKSGKNGISGAGRAS